MKDNLQNIADLIGALAEDIEEIKKMLASKDASAKERDETLEWLVAKFEPLIRFAGSNSFDNINGIFKSKESLAAYKKSMGEVVIASLQENLEADEKNRRKRGIPSMTDLLQDVRKMLAEHMEENKRISEKEQQNRLPTKGFSHYLKFTAVSRRIKSLWHKIPGGWHKNPYAWTGIAVTLVFLTLFAVSWVQWHGYREENIRLRVVADKHKVTTTILKELYPELTISIGAYEKLMETVGADSTLAVFRKQVEKVRKEANKGNKQNESKQ